MRILRIHIQNLNALRGEHLIDFTAAPLADHPLYAIVGPTGAGKTTILDAITLALYGLTERTKNATEASKEVATVMTHGTARCRAELEYETGEGRFRSVWRRRRAHKKVANDLMSSEREIGKYDPLTESYEILATKKREVGEITERVIGLDYDRFVRSVMLTQGDFDRFLKSKPGEKAAILEQITGTAIYRDLSEGAFLRHKIAREAYEGGTNQLQHALPLNREARQVLDSEIEEQLGRSRTLSQHLHQCDQQLERYRGAVLLADKLALTESRVVEVRTAWGLLATDLELLSRNDRVDPYRSVIRETDKLGEEQGENHATLATTEADLIGAVVTKEQDTVAARSMRQNLDAYRKGAAGREESLARAEKLEREIALADRDRQREASDLALHLRSRQNLQLKLDELRESLKVLRTKIGDRTADTLEDELQYLEEEVPLTETKIAKTVHGINYRLLEGRLSNERNREGVLREEIASIQQQLQEDQRMVAAANQEVDLQSLRLDNARLRAQVSEHRHMLESGEPCPLCGSTHHPLPDDDDETTEGGGELRKLQNELTGLQQLLTRRDNALGLTLKKEQNARERYATLTGLLTELKGQLTAPKPLVSLEELQQLQTKLLSGQKEQRDALLLLRTLRISLPEMNRQQLILEDIQQKLAELETDSSRLRESIVKGEKHVAERRNTLSALVGINSSTASLRQQYTGEEEKLRQEKEKAEMRESVSATAVTVIEERRKILNERIVTRAVRLGEMMEALSLGLGKLGLTHEQARDSLLSAGSVGGLRQKIQDARQAKLTAEAMLQETAQSHATAIAALKDLPEESETRHKQEAMAEELTSVQRAIGGLEEQRKEDDKRKEKTAALLEELQLLEKDRDRWAQMNELIGSADGKKFRSFAQSITLQRLVDIGNNHLETISPRYRMQYAPPPPGGKEELELEIVDSYMNDNRRTMSTLSGGETFLVSLALALGLSDLASGKQLIQSLFIDEGFGTLDGKTLDQAMVTLEQLQARGKSIGIISHVQQLRERVVCQIQLEPVGDGFSRIELSS